MIAKLTGLIDSAAEDSLIINVGGVGYLVFCSVRTLNSLAAQGGSVSVFIETHVREDHIHLYGFADQFEQEWFKLLTTVQGVGAKVALAMLSITSPETLAQAIAAALTFTKVASTAASSGLCELITSSSPSYICTNLSARGDLSLLVIRPSATWDRWLSWNSRMPQPVLRSPGSIPSSFMVSKQFKNQTPRRAITSSEILKFAATR